MVYVSRFTSYISRLEPWLLLLLAPFFIFPQPGLTPWLMALIPVLWLCRWWGQGRLTVRTPLDVPLLVVLAMTLVSTWATFDLERSFPKLCGVFFGIAFFYALVNAVRTERAIRFGAVLLLTGAVAVAGLGLVGTRWASDKVPLFSSLLSAVYERVPLLLRGVPRAEEGFSPNQVGGTLTLFIPLVVALLFHQLRRARLEVKWGLQTLSLVGGLTLLVLVLLLTQSRLAYLSTALTLLLLGASQGRWPRIVALVGLALGIGLIVYFGPQRSAQAIFGSRNLEMLTGEISLAGRVEIWKRALRVIRDHPLTGIGFDTLFPVIHARYPTFFIQAGRDATHAHNIFLQVALDLGLPGLMAFVWLLGALGAMLWRVRRRSDAPFHRALATGLFFGLLAQIFYGVADAIALGQKPGLFLWAYLGLGTALWANTTEEREGEGAEERVSHFAFYVSRFTSHVARSPVLFVCLVFVMVSVGWGYSRVARARAWLSLLEADAASFRGLAQGEGAAVRSGEAGALLRQVQSDLRGLQSDLALPLALAPRLGWVPGYGADMAAAPVLLDIGLDLTMVGEQTLAALHPLLGSPGAEGGRENAAEVALATVREARPQLTQALATIERARQARQEIDAERLSPRLASRVSQLDRALPLLEHGLRGTMALPEVLGASERRTYLILVQNDDELRPTGGFISGVARLVVEKGRIVRLDFEDSYAVDDFSQAYPLAPRPLREIMGPVPWVFRDSNWSPDFPTSAQRALELYRLRYEDVEVDGVIALDQQAIQLLVTALQPIDVAAYAQPVRGDNVIELAREAWEPSEEEGVTEAWWQQRKNFMGRVLVAAVRKLQSQPDQISVMRLGWAALRALEEKHLFIYLPDGGSAAEALHEAGWDGSIPSTSGDYLMMVDANLGFNKVDPYITRHLTYTVDLRDPIGPQAMLTLLHRHTGPEMEGPCRHTSRYGLTYEQMMRRCYWDYVRVYAPQGSRLLGATPHPVPGDLLLTGRDRSGEAEVLPSEANKNVFATFLVLAPKEQVRTDFAYDLPVDVLEEADDSWRYRLHIQKQGGTDANDVKVVLILPPNAEVTKLSPPSMEQEEDVLVYDAQLQSDLDLVVRWRTP